VFVVGEEGKKQKAEVESDHRKGKKKLRHRGAAELATAKAAIATEF
jgi:hypothetical protein